MSDKPRALGVVRLSVGNENQTGEETQRTRISKRADAEEMDLVDFAVDIDVSASISPWVRPSLGDWLNNKKDHSSRTTIANDVQSRRKPLCPLRPVWLMHSKSIAAPSVAGVAVHLQ
nr:hypothetical protein [Streptomyces sp. S10(2018)]